MNDNYRSIRSMAQIQLSMRSDSSEARLTSDDIRETVGQLIDLTKATDVDVEEVVADLEGMFATVIGDGKLLAEDDGGWEPWLLKRKADVDWRFWERYRHHLLVEEGWAPATIQKLDDTTDDVLGRLTAPDKPGPWDRRGMVVGNVQSGKTANYIGLICKAADAGYKLIVVLTGFHNSLRSQTQIRLEEGFLGYDWGASSAGPDATVQKVGVGLKDFTFRADSITTRADDGDFRRQVANKFAISPGQNPLLFVVKKNSSVLRNLITWVRGAATAGGDTRVQDIPLLVIDDEADQGSVDTGIQSFGEDGKPDLDHDPRPINRRIRQLLHIFEQSAYVGYTATPFANIFIHEDGATAKEGEDLFPRSFIYSLPTPSNHVGPSVVFGYEADDDHLEPRLPIIRSVKDQATTEMDGNAAWMPANHKKVHMPLTDGADEVPPSLREAIHAFVLVCAARAARGQGLRHNSMLVHVTRFTAVQRTVASQVTNELRTLERRLRHGEGDAAMSRHALRDLWERDFLPTTNEIVRRGLENSNVLHGWDDVEPYLARAVSSIKVREINGLAGEILDYKEHDGTGLNVIAVGGDKLSRGLTLEGLSVSYFLRASKMYDTLMQMGRWFGYRQGYLDLCRLYTTNDMVDWFTHIAEASDELRRDFDRMVASGSTPRDFGQRVRSHPVLLVTSRVKMRHGQTVDLTYDGDISETINFWRDRTHLENNWSAAEKLCATLAAAHGPGLPARHSTASMWEGVEYESILSFLRSYTEHEASKRVKTSLLADYIEAEVSEGRLRTWTVAIAMGEGQPEGRLDSISTRLVERAWHEKASGDLEELKRQNHYRIRRLLNPPDEAADLTQPEFEEAFTATIQEWETNPWSRSDPPIKRKRPKLPSGPAIREARPAVRGLLLLYPLDGGGDEKVDMDAHDIPVIGFGISFPKVRGGAASKVQYRVNNVYYKQEVLGLPQDLDW